MNHPLLRALQIRLCYIPVLMVLTLFGFKVLKMDFLPEITVHILFGFISFLKDMRAQLPFDTRWLASLLGLFVSVAAIGQVFARRFGKGRNLVDVRTSVALGLILPLFVVSLPLLSGFWTAWKSVVTRPLAIDYPDEDGPRLRFGMEVFRHEVFEHASRSGETFPERLEEVAEWAPFHLRRLQSFSGNAGPGDPLLYLGAGLGPRSDRSLALMITPRFEGDEGDERWLVTIGGEEKKIGEEELDGWIRRSLEARKK